MHMGHRVALNRAAHMVDLVVGKLCGNSDQIWAEVGLQAPCCLWAIAERAGIEAVAIDGCGVVLRLEALQIHSKVQDV